MLNKAIEVKFKNALYTQTIIWEIDVYYQKNRILDKKKEFFKPLKEEYKAKLVKSQLALSGKTTQLPSQKS